MDDWSWLSIYKKPRKVTIPTFVLIAVIVVSVFMLMFLSVSFLVGKDNCKKILSSFDKNTWPITTQKYKDDYSKCNKGDALSIISVGWDYWGGGFTP